MKIVAKEAPSIVKPGAGSPSSRDRAVSKLQTLMKTNAQAPSAPVNPEPLEQLTPVRNATRISPEELSAIRPNRPQVNEIDGQPGNTEPSVPGESPLEAVSTAEAGDLEQAPKEATPSQEEPLSKQYAILARKEKALRAKVQAQEQAIKAREDALAAREQTLTSKDSDYKSNFISKDDLASDPIGTLAKLGFNYDKLTEMVLNPPQTDPRTMALLEQQRQELQAMRDEMKQSRTEAQENQKKAYDQAVNQIRVDVKNLVNTSADFEMIKETGSIDDVVELIEETYKADGVILSNEDACREIEEYLLDEAVKISRLKKIQQRLAPKPSATATAVPATGQTAKPQQPQEAKTLTNSIASSSRLTSKQRAVLAFQGKLNNR